MQAMSGADAMVLAGRVLMQLGSQEKAVSDAVKEVIRILKKTQPAQVPQVCISFKCVCCAQTDCSCRCPTAPLQYAKNSTARCSGFGQKNIGAWPEVI